MEVSITVKFLPPNTISVLQPCDMGIIRTLKAYFRHQLRQNIIDTIDDSQEELCMRTYHRNLHLK
uniref:DDE-1 domain-containing protein n=1 Tax=Eptatretus burgeri TaxID=7764 RepID=A0A8C4WZS8_EPTBU